MTKLPLFPDFRLRRRRARSDERSGGGVGDGGAEIDDVCACAYAVYDGTPELCGSSAGYGALVVCVFQEDGAQDESAVGTDPGGGMTATSNEHPNNKGPVHASHTIQAGTRAVNVSREFLDPRLVQIGVTKGNRTIN